MSAKKQTVKPAVKKAAASKAAASPSIKKGDMVAFTGWEGDPLEGGEEIKMGMVGKVRSVSDEEIEVIFELEDGTIIVPLLPAEVKAAKASSKTKAVKADEDEDEDDDSETEDEESDEEEDEDEDEEEEVEQTIGELADEGDKKAIRELTKAAKSAGLDPNDYSTWAELEEALSDESDEEEESDEEDEDEEEAVDYSESSVSELRAECKERGLSTRGSQAALISRLEEDDADTGDTDEEEDTVVEDGTRKGKAAATPAREPSLGRQADEGDKAAERELRKRAKAVGLDADDEDNGETWTQFERTLKAAEKEASRPQLKLTSDVTAELGEDGSDAVKAAKRLLETAERTYYTLGGVLAYIDRNATYEGVKVKGEKPYQGKEGFALFCSEHLGVEYRKARYLINIYEAFSGAGLNATKIANIGWSKAKELVAILVAEPEAADKWIELAKTSSTGKLQESVKARLTKIGAKQHGNSNERTRSVICKFVVHADEGKVVEQALALAKEQSDTESDSEAFAYIVKEWISYQGS